MAVRYDFRMRKVWPNKAAALRAEARLARADQPQLAPRNRPAASKKILKNSQHTSALRRQVDRSRRNTVASGFTTVAGTTAIVIAADVRGTEIVRRAMVARNRATSLNVAPKRGRLR